MCREEEALLPLQARHVEFTEGFCKRHSLQEVFQAQRKRMFGASAVCVAADARVLRSYPDQRQCTAPHRVFGRRNHA
jgi:hypothetical protein